MTVSEQFLISETRFNTLKPLDRQTLPFGVGTWSLAGQIKYGKVHFEGIDLHFVLDDLVFNKNESVTKTMNAYGDLYGIHQD